MAISENIKRFRTDRDWTQEQLAEKIGVTRSTVTQWETGWSKPRMGAVEKLAAVFGVSASDMITDRSGSSPFVDVPLYGSIAAGTPIEMNTVDCSHPVPAKMREKYPDAFLLKVEGDSMNRVLPNGCYALVNPCKEVAVDNKPYAVCVNGYNATIKRVRKLNNGFELVPDSNDPTYKPTVFDYGEPGTETITVIGRVVWYCVPFDFEL